MAVGQLETGDYAARKLSRALKNGTKSITSPDIRSRVNLLHSLLKRMQFSVNRTRGPLLMRADSNKSPRMYVQYGERMGEEYALVNANINAPYVVPTIDFETESYDEARVSLGHLFRRRLFGVNKKLRALHKEGAILGVGADVVNTVTVDVQIGRASCRERV